MATTLSSRWTPFYKFMLPVLCIGGMGYGAWRVFAHPSDVRLPPGVSAEQGWMLVLALTVIVAGVIWWMVAPLKHVELHDGELWVSNYTTEIHVPLTAVASISGASMSNPKRYTITFSEPTEFGRRITLLPPMQWSLMMAAEAEEIGELRQAWQAACAAADRRR